MMLKSTLTVFFAYSAVAVASPTYHRLVAVDYRTKNAYVTSSRKSLIAS